MGENEVGRKNEEVWRGAAISSVLAKTAVGDERREDVSEK